MDEQPLKILQIVSGSNVNGAVVHCGLLSHRLARAGHSVTVLTRPNAWFKDRFAGSDFTTLDSTLKRKPSEIHRIAQFIRDQRFDLIHTHMSSAHTFGIIMKWLTGVPCVATAHHCRFQLHWRFNDFVIANSESTRKFHLRVNRVNPNRLRTVYCYTDLDAFLNSPDRARLAIQRQQMIPRGNRMIGIIGDVCRRKGHVYLAQALPALLKAYPDLVVLFIGSYSKTRDPYVRSVQNILCRNGTFPRVRWLGRRSDIPQLVNSLDVCVIPSVEEPLGLVAIEALAAGTPVVATNTGGLPEIVKHEERGLLVPPSNSRAIHQAVARMLDNPDWADQMAQTGRKFVTQAFAPGPLTEQVEHVYRRVVGDRASNNCPNAA